MPIVSNSSPLIGLDQIGQLDLLHCLFEEIFIPDGVSVEVSATVRIWMMAQISRPRTPWTSQTFIEIAVLAASAAIAVLGWPSIAGYVSGFVPQREMNLVPGLASCVVAAGLAAVAFTTRNLLT